MEKKSLTLIELISVIVIMSILLIVGGPRFIDFQEEAQMSVEKQNVGRIRIGINTYYIESIIQKRSSLYPERLDQAANSSASRDNPFFTNVLNPPGITNRRWRKLNDNLYQAPSGNFYTYDSVTGQFLKQ